MSSSPDSVLRSGFGRRGTVASPGPINGYGFIEPDDGGGQLLVRDRSIAADLRLRVGEKVVYNVATGSFAVEAVDVRRLAPGAAGE